MESVVRGMGVRAPAPGGSEVEGSAVQQCSEVKWSAPGPGGTWAFATDTCHRHRRWSTLVSLTRCIFWHYLILFKCFIFRLWQIALLGLKESCVVCENSSQQKKKSWNWSSFFFAPGMGPGQFFRRLPLTMEDNYDNNTGSPVPSITKRRLVVDEVELMAMNGTSVQRPPPSPSRSRVNRRSLRVCRYMSDLSLFPVRLFVYIFTFVFHADDMKC